MGFMVSEGRGSYGMGRQGHKSWHHELLLFVTRGFCFAHTAGGATMAGVSGAATAARPPPSTSSRRTTASRWPTWCVVCYYTSILVESCCSAATGTATSFLAVDTPVAALCATDPVNLTGTGRRHRTSVLETFIHTCSRCPYRALGQVSYNAKHNEANGEDNRDGEQHNNSWNCGDEGPSSKWEVNVSAGAP